VNERILLGVTGSIACYKAPFILRGLNRLGFRVPVVMTRAAKRFVGSLTFQALTNEGVYDTLWAKRQALSHITLLDGTSLVLVAPATANIIAKAAAGVADDLLSSLLLASDPARILFAPAMNEGMWNNPVTQDNVDKLRKRGSGFVEPASGDLACGISGKGRLAGIEDILLGVERGVRIDPILSGKRIVITCGSTEEELDPVRVVTNRSSGLMGMNLARSFSRIGADVTLVAGSLSAPLPPGINVIRAFSSTAMLDELKKVTADADALIMAAAIADYAPIESRTEKLKDDELTLKLRKTPDILASLETPGTVRIGFSVETGKDWTATAADKLKKKKLDAVVANPAWVIAQDSTEAVIHFSSGKQLISQPISKEMLAEKLVEVTRELIKERDG